MYVVLEVIHLTLLTIAKAVFDSSFLIILMMIFFMIRKTKQANIYGYTWPFQQMSHLIESTLQGVIIGWLGSVLMTWIGLPIRITTAFLFLLPIALILSMIHPRFLCFSYASSILGWLGLLFQGQTIGNVVLPDLALDISGLMGLVGVLHLMEALLVFIVGGKYAIPVITKKKNQLVMGHILQRFWPIPLALLIYHQGAVSGNVLNMPSWWPWVRPSLESGVAYYYALLPIVGALGYRTITFAYKPEDKARRSSLRLLIYSLGLILIGMLSLQYHWFKIIGLLYMALIHEAIIQYDQYIEGIKEPLYLLPSMGIRVLSVYPNGFGDKMGIEVGDIIYKINGEVIKDSKDFIHKTSNLTHQVKFEVKKMNGRKIEYSTWIDVGENKQLGIQSLPEKPAIVLKYESLNDFSLLQILLKKLNKKI